MKTVKKVATQAKTPRYVVSTPEGVKLNASNKELVQTRIVELQSEFVETIYFDDHKEKRQLVYQRSQNQKNYRILKGNYVAPKIEVATPQIES